MNTPSLRIHFDDRGVSRSLLDLWLPHLNVDAVWLVGSIAADEEATRDAVPFIAMSPVEAAAIATEAGDAAICALALFSDLVDLAAAARFGLPPARVTVTRLGGDTAMTARVAPEVYVDGPALATLRELEECGFCFEIQPLPNVTARPWTTERLASIVESDPAAR